jgi:conjugative transfer signal peptidase TraF
MPGHSSKPVHSPIKKVLFFIQLFVWPVLIVMIAGAAGFRLNLTSSVPIGLYRITEDPKAEFVAFCPPEPFGSLSVIRGYREQSGVCPDHGTPLLKPIVAREGDVVESSAKGISVNGKLLPNTAAQHRDSGGRPMEARPFGRFSVAAGTVWVVSSYDFRSFDSRYFGPVTLTNIKHHLRPVWTAR